MRFSSSCSDDDGKHKRQVQGVTSLDSATTSSTASQSERHKRRLPAHAADTSDAAVVEAMWRRRVLRLPHALMVSNRAARAILKMTCNSRDVCPQPALTAPRRRQSILASRAAPPAFSRLPVDSQPRRFLRRYHCLSLAPMFAALAHFLFSFIG